MSPGGFVCLLVGATLTAGLGACSTPPASPLDSLHQATVLIEHAKGHGSGTIVGPHAVLTAYHVVQEDPLTVTFFNGPTAGARLTWFDEKLDLALVDVEVPHGYPMIELACDDLRAGQHLVSVGHPTQSRWVAVGGYLPSTSSIGAGQLVPLGFPIGLGTSGGPVFDETGQVVGIALAILAERNRASAAYDRYKDTGIGLMLPARDFCDALGAMP
ncbi:MAG TPA: serine protease [Geminicoccaceae bacterium]|nr:serine protease [Geminicoccaceae bacterium]